MNMNSCIEELKWRGLLQDASDLEGIAKLSGCSAYAGFDPTATSLHVGNFIPIALLRQVSRAGLSPIILFGGATGFIGDPSGRNSERSLLTREQIEENVETQKLQVQKIFERINFKPEVVDNYEWTKDVTVLSFLREIGKHFTVNYMMQKDSVKTRLDGEGMSFTEFSYMLLQAMDFLHLYQTKGCRLQIGGSDQWGNITAGLELIRKKIQGEAFAMSAPLITDSSGKKIGKSTGGGSVWLDPKLTSPFKFHQYWLNIEDQDVIRFIKLLTLLEPSKISELETAVKSAPHERLAQKALADEMCDTIHGASETALAKRSAQVLFGGSIDGIAEEQLEVIFQDVPSSQIPSSEINSMSYVDLLVRSGLAKSKGEARRLITNGGAYLNNERVTDAELNISASSAANQRLIVLRSGKKSYHVVKRT